LHDLPGGDGPEVDFGVGVVRVCRGGPVGGPAEMGAGLAEVVGGLPDSGAGPEAVVLAGAAVVGVDVGGHGGGSGRGSVPQGAGHADEREGGGGELLDGPFGQDRGGVVALAGEPERHGGPGARDGAEFEPGSPRVAVRAEVAQAAADGFVFEVEGG